MLKNYLIVAIRNLRRNKIFSFINITGLALGMACSLLIMLWVIDEKSVDGFHANNPWLYNVYEHQFYDGKEEGGYYTPGLLGMEMKKVLPEVELATDYGWTDKVTFQVGDKIIKEEGTYASPDFFSMLSFPLLKGKATESLNEALAISISKKMAEHFFGSADAALGKTIRCDNRRDFKIKAVFDNVPENSSMKFDFVINWDAFLEDNSWAKEWGNNGPHTTIQLKKNTNPVAFKKRIRKFLDNYNKDQSANFRIELDMQPYADSYLYGHFKNGQIDGGRIEYVRLFSIIAVFVLVIACINFMNLTTARSVKRAKEIGVRKVVGAMRGVLMRQFIGEAVFLACLASFIALLLVFLLLPMFNSLTSKEIHLPLDKPFFWLEFLGLAFVTGIISGSYPALFLSAFNPIKVLKGTVKFSFAATFFRKGLVTFQFILSILLIIGTIIVSKQVSYIQNKNLGYDRENLIYVPLEGDLTPKYEVFKDAALNKTGIKSVSRITQTPTSIDNNTGGVQWEGKDPNTSPMFTQASVGYDFIKTMNIQLIAGRDFSKEFPTDSVGYVVNESALKRFGYKDPIGRPLTFWQKKGKIIGVVKDFHFNSLRVPIEPLVLRFGEKETYGNMLIKTEAGKTKEALASIESLCHDLNARFPFTYQFSDEEFQKLYKTESVIDKLSTSFAVLAIFISCLGLLGLAMFTAEQRTKEFGIRKVLGASISSLFSLLSKEFLALVFLALVVASPLAWWVMTKWLQDYTYRTTISWWIFAIAGALAIIIALITISSQAIKAALANPVRSLRSE
jgi:putative ABC transport system permease protein